MFGVEGFGDEPGDVRALGQEIALDDVQIQPVQSNIFQYLVFVGQFGFVDAVGSVLQYVD